MGCFLGCFGLEKRKKRRKPGKKYLSIEQNHGRYVPLDSDATTKLKFTENNTDSDAAELKKKLKNPQKTKKKVSFNLNVKAYEPIPCDEQNYFSDGEDEDKTTDLHYEVDLIASNIRPYRYQNFVDDEDDHFIYDENDLSFDDDDDEEEETLHSSESDNEMLSQDMEKGEDINYQAGGKSGNFYSVLHPIENLTQWKEVKARKAPLEHAQKENTDSSHQCMVGL